MNKAYSFFKEVELEKSLYKLPENQLAYPVLLLALRSAFLRNRSRWLERFLGEINFFPEEWKSVRKELLKVPTWDISEDSFFKELELTEMDGTRLGVSLDESSNEALVVSALTAPLEENRFKAILKIADINWWPIDHFMGVSFVESVYDKLT